MFETSGQHDVVAYFVAPSEGGNAYLYTLDAGVSPGTKSNWNQYALDAPYGWVGGWPYTGGQFYLGAGRRGKYVDTSAPVVKLTQDIASGLIDVTHNLKSLDAYAGGAATDREHQVIRLTPRWSSDG